MKIYERFLDAYTEMLSRFFDFGEKTMFLANEDVQRSYERLENEDRFYILTGALLTGIYWVLNRIYGMTTR